MIWVNSENVRHLPTPPGGVTAGRIGRDGGDRSFELYREATNVAFAPGLHPIQVLGACTMPIRACPPRTPVNIVRLSQVALRLTDLARASACRVDRCACR